METDTTDASTDAAAPAAAFVARWTGVTGSELATAQSFVADLCEPVHTQGLTSVVQRTARRAGRGGAGC